MWSHHGDCGGNRRARWGGAWGFEQFGDLWGGRGPRRPRQGGRVFEQGDLKLVILRLLEEKPRHGYEIIKELETRSAGAYSPSPGTVYPTLTMLEDMGFARTVPEESGKKIYEITDEGRKHLAENGTAVDDIFIRFSKLFEGFMDGPKVEVIHALRDVGRATFTTAMPHLDDKELISKVREVLSR